MNEVKIFCQVRSSHRRSSVRKGVPRNFAKLTGKHLCQSLFLIKLQAEAKEIFKNTLFTEHLRTTASVRSNSKKIVLEKGSF